MIKELFNTWYVFHEDHLNCLPNRQIITCHQSIEAAAESVLERNSRHCVNPCDPPDTTYRAVPFERVLMAKQGEEHVRELLVYVPVHITYHHQVRLTKVLNQRRIRLTGSTPRQPYEQLAEARAYKRKKTANRKVAEAFRETLQAVREHNDGECTFNQCAVACRDFYDTVNGNLTTRTRERIFTKFVELVEDLWFDAADLPFRKVDCGDWTDEWTTVASGDTVCSECLSDHYLEIDGDYYHEDTCYYWESDGEYHLSPEPEDEEDEEDEEDLLHGWVTSTSGLSHQSPNRTNQWDGEFTIGVELEVEATYYRSDALKDAQSQLNSNNVLDLRRYCMFKRDGSLSDARGFEIVTAARPLSDHIKVFKQWKPSGVMAWQAGNCGMHTHIDSRAFSSLTLGKFLMLFNAAENAQFIRAIAGRHPQMDSQAESYAQSLGNTANPVVVKQGASRTRYYMVNLTNLTYEEAQRLGCEYDRNSKGSYSTVEVRIYRATLKKERLLAQLEFTHAALMYCRVASWHQLDGANFKLWLAKTPGYPHLAAWLGVPVCRTTALRKQVSVAATSDE